MTSNAKDHIRRNRQIHDRIAAAYDGIHDEIFNEIEQSRLRDALNRATEGLGMRSQAPRALDFGCGSGNLTRHLLALGFEVTAADVSESFLQLIAERSTGRPVQTHRIDGETLAGLPDASFDLTATYSVLHHVPDYLAAVREMARVTRPGGVVYIDHEHTPAFWKGNPVHKEFLCRARKTDWRKYLVPRNYYGKLRRLLIDPRFANEGDIHVWPDDHIEWTQIGCALEESGFQPLFEEEYLLFRSDYRPEVYEAYRLRCTDMRTAAYVKSARNAR